MKHGSLFSGIGGFDLAAEWMGWQNVFHCEWNSFGQKVLKYYWPEAISYEDITKTDFSVHRGHIDILTGGFPCQPYSLAGLRKGKEDERHLWPEMLRAVREIKPRWIVGENVLGLVGWDDGLVFEEVQADLEAQGYEVQPYVLPAAAVGAPHRRDRVWFIAHRSDPGTESLRQEWQDSVYRSGAVTNTSCWRLEGRTGCKRKIENTPERTNLFQSSCGPCAQRSASDTNCKLRRAIRRYEARFRRETKEHSKYSHIGRHANVTDSNGFRLRGESNGLRKPGLANKESPSNCWDNFPTQPPVRNGNDGFPTESLRQRIREDCMGILSEKEIDKIISEANTEWRNESIKAGGNAIVPQVVYQIFKAIQEYENQN